MSHDFAVPEIVKRAAAAFVVSWLTLATVGAASSLPPAWNAFEFAWSRVASYSATITVFERKGTKVQNNVFIYTYHRPSSATVYVKIGPNAGVTLEWDGGETLVAHRGSGLLGMFKKRLSLHDPLATTIRGASVDQLSFASILAHGQNTPGTSSQAPGPVIQGVPTVAATLVPVLAVDDAGLTLEIVDISSATFMPVRVLGYDGSTLVRRVDFSNVKLNI